MHGDDLTPGRRVVAAAIEWTFAQDCSNALAELMDSVADLAGAEYGEDPSDDELAAASASDGASPEVVGAAVGCVRDGFDASSVDRLAAAVSGLVGYRVVDGDLVDLRTPPAT